MAHTVDSAALIEALGISVSIISFQKGLCNKSCQNEKEKLCFISELLLPFSEVLLGPITFLTIA